jgi:hypothetical protein
MNKIKGIAEVHNPTAIIYKDQPIFYFFVKSVPNSDKSLTGWLI